MRSSCQPHRIASAQPSIARFTDPCDSSFCLFLLRIGISALSNRLSHRLALALLHRRPPIINTFHSAYSAPPGMTLADPVEHRRALLANLTQAARVPLAERWPPSPRAPAVRTPSSRPRSRSSRSSPCLVSRRSTCSRRTATSFTLLLPRVSCFSLADSHHHPRFPRRMGPDR